MSQGLTKVPAPKVGIHRGIADAVYHSWDLCSSSRLRTIHNLTEAHLKCEMDAQREETEETAVGTAAHTLIFQSRQVLDLMFAIGGPINEKTGKEYGRDTKAFETWLAEQGKQDVLRVDELNRALAIAHAVQSDPITGPAIAACKDRELSIVAPIGDGVLCKGRIDGIGAGMLLDLKTTGRGISEEDFQRSLASRGYGIQAALYRQLCDTLGIPVIDVAYIVAESEPPYCARLFRLKDEVLADYDELLPGLIDRYARCIETGNWPGYPSQVVEVGLPPWHAKKIAEMAAVVRMGKEVELV